MRRIALALLVLGLAACDGEDPVDSVIRDVSAANHAAAAAAEAEAAEQAAPRSVPASVPATTTCDVEVSFGSYGTGPDGALRDKIMALASADPGVTSSKVEPWGREGEATLCLNARDDAAANQLYGTIAAQLPSTSTRAPTTVRHRDGRSHATTYPVSQ